jgi:hypothetical protein
VSRRAARGNPTAALPRGYLPTRGDKLATAFPECAFRGDEWELAEALLDRMIAVGQPYDVASRIKAVRALFEGLREWRRNTRAAQPNSGAGYGAMVP